MPNYPNARSLSSSFPSPKRDALTVNEWTHSNSHQSSTEEKIQNLRPTIKLDAVLPPMRISPWIIFFFYPRETLKRNTLPPTRKKSYVASARTTIGPTRVLNFPAVSTKKRRPSRPADYCLGKPEISGAPNPPPLFLRLQPRTCTHTSASSISRHFSKEKKYYLLIPDCPFRYFLTFHFLSTQP